MFRVRRKTDKAAQSSDIPTNFIDENSDVYSEWVFYISINILITFATFLSYLKCDDRIYLFKIVKNSKIQKPL